MEDSIEKWQELIGSLKQDAAEIRAHNDQPGLAEQCENWAAHLEELLERYTVADDPPPILDAAQALSAATTASEASAEHH